MYQTLLRAEDLYVYELLDKDFLEEKKLQVLDYEKTISLLLEKPQSFCRIGDGEIDLIQGRSISFQEYDINLAEILKEILKIKCENLYVGINYNYFHSSKMLNDYNRKFYLTSVKPYRDFLNENCCKDRTYIAAGFNQLYMVLDDFDYKEHFERLKKLFLNREIVVFAGEGIIENLKYNIFDYAKDCIYENGPIKNSFSQYERLLECSRNFPKNKILCYILGPTSKALVYKLSKEGYMAWDIGHLAKDYDMYCQKIDKSPENIINFFSPD